MLGTPSLLSANAAKPIPGSSAAWIETAARAPTSKRPRRTPIRPSRLISGVSSAPVVLLLVPLISVAPFFKFLSGSPLPGDQPDTDAKKAAQKAHKAALDLGGGY